MSNADNLIERLNALDENALPLIEVELLDPEDRPIDSLFARWTLSRDGSSVSAAPVGGAIAWTNETGKNLPLEIASIRAHLAETPHHFLFPEPYRVSAGATWSLRVKITLNPPTPQDQTSKRLWERVAALTPGEELRAWRTESGDLNWRIIGTAQYG